MPESIQYLENELRAKKHELGSVSSTTAGASIGALLTHGSVIGAAAGALLARDKDKKDQIERDIASLKSKLQETRDHISRLQMKRSDLMNTYQNDKARFDADMRQKYNDLEQQKSSAQTPELIRQLDDQIMKFQDELRQQEVSRDRAHELELNAIQ